jgi:4-amino-4-deoxy-L-arabinose transferase-like glycosyltransferase
MIMAKGKRTNYLWVLIAIFVGVHGLLLVHDWRDPEALLKGDRAGGRIEKIQYLLGLEDRPDACRNLTVPATAPDSTADRLIVLGDAGDYVLDAALFAVGGGAAIIGFQLVLALIAAISVYRLAVLLGQPRRYAFIAAAVYILLPGSLMQPHTLVTEGLFNPLVVIALYLIVRGVEEEFRRGVFMLALALLAVAIFVRLQLLLYPIVLAVILGYHWRDRGLSRTVPIFLVCFLFPLGWMLFVYVQTGQFSMGASDHSFGRNLFETAARMARIGHRSFDPSAYPGKEMSVPAFVSTVLDNPGIYLRLKASELTNQFLNPGVYIFAGHYLGILETTSSWTYWKEIRDQQGLLSVAVEIIRWGPTFAVVFFGSALIWGLFLVFTALGLVVFVRDWRSTDTSKTILISYLVYGALIVQASSGVRWTHRTPIEFVMVLLFSAGIEWTARRWNSARSTAKTPA